MAKYTEIFADFLNGGGTLPAPLSEIDGFPALFVARFCDKEIGFETEQLFQIKLDERAEIIIPAYKERIKAVQDAWNKASDAIKNRIRTFTAGKQIGNQYALPINSQTAQPSGKTETEGYTDTDNVTESGYTPDEVLKRQQYLDGLYERKWLIIDACLHEFDSLFMKVY